MPEYGVIVLGPRPFPSIPAGANTRSGFDSTTRPAGGTSFRYLCCILGICGTGKMVMSEVF